MNFLADEGVDRQIVDHLLANGHDVYYAAESAPACSDEELLRWRDDLSGGGASDYSIGSADVPGATRLKS